MNLVVLSSCSPANACLINLIARRHPVQHVFRVTWSANPTSGSRWRKFAQSPVSSVVERVRRKFFERLYERIEIDAAERLTCEGTPPHLDLPTTDIDARQINSVAFQHTLRALEPDVLLVSACPLLKPETFEIPRLATINVHRGIAPHYRGERTIFWPLYQRDFDHVGVTLHQIDRGIDTGPVLGYGYPALSADDTESSLLAKCIKVAAQLANTSLETAETDGLLSTRQPTAGRCYYRRDQRIWKELAYRLERSLGLRSIPIRPERIEMLLTRREPAIVASEQPANILVML